MTFDTESADRLTMRYPRLDYPGARHHVMNRTARHETVFDDDQTRGLFLSLLADLPKRFGVRVHGYALMPNHYHLLVESVLGELPRAMRHLGGEFSRRLNREYGWDGPLFRGRYRNRLVGSEEYWRHLLLYVHANPVRAGLVHADTGLWTSHRCYLGDEPRPPWLETAELQNLFGTLGAYAAAWQQLLDGSWVPPEDFLPAELWRPASTGVVAVTQPHDTTWDVADALAAVGAATGLSLDEIRATRRGGVPNPANWLAAWWMSRYCGIPHGQIVAALATRHDALSRVIRRVEQRRHTDPTLAGWIAKLSGDLRTLPRQ